MRKREGSGRTWLSETSGPGKGHIVTAQFKGARASSFMARSANTMWGKTLEPAIIEEWTFLGKGGGRAKASIEVSDLSHLAGGLAFKASQRAKGAETRALAMGSYFFQGSGTSLAYTTQAATSSCQATKPIFSFVKYETNRQLNFMWHDLLIGAK